MFCSQKAFIFSKISIEDKNSRDAEEEKDMEAEGMNYSQILGSLKEKINQARIRAVLTVNAELLGIHWEIGQMIAMHEAEVGWGGKIIDRLAEDLRSAFPDMKGFSSRNLRYMREFYQAYPFPILQPPVAKLEMESQTGNDFSQSNENQYGIILQPLVAKLPWSHHVVILTKVRETKDRVFYIQKSIENGWSKMVLDTQIETKLHLRQGTILNNFNDTLPKLQSDLARETFKNPYIFDFLSSGEQLQERDLEKALIQHIKKFMLELGKGFAFVANQYRLQIEGDEFILDLLFYNYVLHAFVLFELKLSEFQPEFAGKLNFYINAVDAQLKGPGDKPTIGVLLCKTRNSTVVKYALKGIDTPMGISEYQLAEAVPHQLTGEIPGIAELEAEMEKEYSELQRPVDQKLDRVKAMMQQFSRQGQKESRNAETTLSVFERLWSPVIQKVQEALQALSSQFGAMVLQYGVDGLAFESQDAALGHLRQSPDCERLTLELRMPGSPIACIAGLDIVQVLICDLEAGKFRVACGMHGRETTLLESPYHEHPGADQIQGIAEAFVMTILDALEAALSQLLAQDR